MLKKDKLDLGIIFGLTMGALSIGWIVWNRLIRVRLPIDLTIEEKYSLRFWIILYLFILFLILLILDCKKFVKKLIKIPLEPSRISPLFARWISKELSKNPRLVKGIEIVLQFIIKYITGAPLFLWRYLYLHNRRNMLIFYLFESGERILGYFQQKENFEIRIIRTTIILGYLPKIIVFWIFLYEIAINKHLELFYTLAPILLIPLIFNGYLRILFDICYYERTDFEIDIELKEVRGKYPEADYIFANRKPDILCNEKEFLVYASSFITENANIVNRVF